MWQIVETAKKKQKDKKKKKNCEKKIKIVLEKWKMHGIQHLFRQHAMEKQSSVDSWHSANQGFAPYANGRAGTNESISDMKPPVWNQGL